MVFRCIFDPAHEATGVVSHNLIDVNCSYPKNALHIKNSNNWPGSFQEKCTIVSGRRTTTEPPVAMIVHLSDSGDIKKTAILFCAIHILYLKMMHMYYT